MEKTGADASLLFVPPAFAADAMMEAADAGIKTCVCVTDGLPAQDMMKVKRFLRRYPREKKMRLIGPNLRGHHQPRKGLHGASCRPIIYTPGRVGIVGRSGTLGYEAASQMSALGIGVSSSIGIGGDPINGSSFKDILELFENDPETDAVIMIGEIGGPQEAEAAAYVRDHMTKPVAAYVAGLSAPKGRKMGHAGAIISAFGESAQEKGRDPAGRGHHGRAEPLLHGRDGRAHARPEGSGMTRAETFPMLAMREAEDWVGRTEERWGCLTPELAGMMNAAVSHPLSLRRDVRRGCLDAAALALGGFPGIRAAQPAGRGRAPETRRFPAPLAFKRRMWAAGKLSFSGSLRIGERLRRISTIKSVTPKSGGTGEMVFVTVAHQVEGETGSFVEEEQDNRLPAYPRKLHAPQTHPGTGKPRFRRDPCRSTRRGFSVSAATYNAHRIHYDLTYAREVEEIPRPSSRTGPCRRSC